MSPQEILEKIGQFEKVNLDKVPTTLEVGFDTWKRIRAHPHVMGYTNPSNPIPTMCGLQVTVLDVPFHFEIK